jgi:hypothetical protein
MKVESILVSAFLLAASSFVLGQRVTSGANRVESPAPQQVLLKTNGQEDKTIADILAVTPDLPRGPQELLQEYRDQLTLVSQALSAELVVISKAVQSGQIKRADAEYLIQQRYELALMQYEVFTALHDNLEYEVVQTADAAVPPQRSCRADAVVVVQGPPPLSSGHTRNPLTRSSR